MNFVHFILDCILYAIGYSVGDVYTSNEIHSKAFHGIIGGLILVVSSFLMIEKFCLDFDRYPKNRVCIPLTIIGVIVITVIYFALVYWFKYR